MGAIPSKRPSGRDCRRGPEKHRAHRAPRQIAPHDVRIRGADQNERVIEMSRQRFEELVTEALDRVPGELFALIDNCVVLVEDEPPADDPDLLGLYEGTPLTERDWSRDAVLPDKITLFQFPIEDASDDEDDVVVAIGETLIHEIGHYFGLSEEQIEEIEERYWRGDEDAVE